MSEGEFSHPSGCQEKQPYFYSPLDFPDGGPIKKRCNARRWAAQNQPQLTASLALKTEFNESALTALLLDGCGPFAPKPTEPSLLWLKSEAKVVHPANKKQLEWNPKQ